MSDKSVNKEVIVGFDKNIMSAIFSPGKSNEESNYYKRVYPTELPIKAQLNEREFSRSRQVPITDYR